MKAMKNISSLGIGVVLLCSLAGKPARAQEQSQSAQPGSTPGSSLGDYARHVRKDPGAPSKPKVFDNDNLPREDKLSIVGTPSSQEAAATQPAADQNASSAPAAADSKSAAGTKAGEPTGPAVQGDEATRKEAIKQWTDKFDSQQQQVDLAQRELDVTQREYQVRAAAMYADAGNRLRNSADWDKQDAQYKQQIADKQKAIEDAKQKLDDMKEEARKAGVPNSAREQ